MTRSFASLGSGLILVFASSADQTRLASVVYNAALAGLS
jgi:hypothetical protein